MNPQERFSDRAIDYALYRPSYPSEAIDAILKGLSAPSQLIVADIGARTGISSRLLADRGIKVIAIEPNAAMRQAAKPDSLVKFQDGNAENTKLENNSVDLVTCFQAFHWFNREPTLKEFARILKPKGRLAAVCNNRARQDEFTAEYSHFTKTVSNNQSELRYAKRFLRETFLFSTVTLLTFPARQVLDRLGLVGRAMSTSYIPKRKPKEQFIGQLYKLYDKYRDGQSLVYFNSRLITISTNYV
jgi:SAM-dependent methyltransferase